MISMLKTAVSSRCDWIHIDDGLPDGMTVDENDNLWIAHYNG